MTFVSWYEIMKFPRRLQMIYGSEATMVQIQTILNRKCKFPVKLPDLHICIILLTFILLKRQMI